MLKRLLSLSMVALIFCVGFTGLNVSAAEADVATFTFDTPSALSFFYNTGDIDANLSITNEYGFTGKALKVEVDIPDNSNYEAKFLLDASRLKMANFNDCIIEAHILFPSDYSTVIGPGNQSATLLLTDPSWIDAKSDSSKFGAWQTLTVKDSDSSNNRSLGFCFPIAANNQGKFVCYIDDIRIIKDNAVIASLDMDTSLTYPLPTDTATFAKNEETTDSESEDTDADTAASSTSTSKIIYVEETSGAPTLLIVLFISLLIIAVVVGVIYFFLWKSKNKYY